MNERDAKFLRVHSMTLGVSSAFAPPLHIGFGCIRGTYRLQGRIIAIDEPEVVACALRKITRS